MACRDILCAIESNDGLLTPAFHQALALAVATKSHLTTEILARKAQTPGSVLGAAAVSGALAVANQKAHHTASTALAAAEEAARIAGIVHDGHIRDAQSAVFAEWIGRRARLSDVVVVDQAADTSPARDLVFEQTLFSSGRPTILASGARIAESVSRIGVAWNGSAVAARALGDALGCFSGIRSVDILCVVDRKAAPKESKDLPGADVARHLARHGLEANVVDLPLQDGGVAETLDNHATQNRIDLLVMGGYGHSRFREFVLGGVTRGLSRQARTPILLSH